MPNIIRFGGTVNKVPSIFGSGINGDLTVTGTTSLNVPVAHTSIIEKQYRSLTINVGAMLTCATYNAGLIIRVRGDCTIHGTIDQSGLAPKTNLQNNYAYPSQLRCGDGGRGGGGGKGGGSVDYSGGTGGTYMPGRIYGGGYGGGGGGGTAYSGHGSYSGGDGGSAATITINTDMFIGGIVSQMNDYGVAGTYGGGGSGSGGEYSGNGGSGDGHTGGFGNAYGGGGGGAGSAGGGVILLYVGGNLLIDGYIKCNGRTGGNGGSGNGGGGGGSGGGGGGGAIYIYHKGTYSNTGSLQVNGGAGGAAGSSTSGYGGRQGSAGEIGSITVVQYTE